MKYLTTKNYGMSQPSISTEIKKENIENISIISFLNIQPQINPDLNLLHSKYDHDGLLLDIYGECDDGEFIVYNVVLTGTKVSLEALVSIKMFDDIAAWCERHYEKLLQQDQDECRISNWKENNE
jgi:hypothetical protein